MSNIFIVHTDPDKSAMILDRRRLFSSIYEGIHVLASNLDLTDKLVTPKRDISNHPCAKQWEPYPEHLFIVLQTYYHTWYKLYSKKSNYFRTVNYKNLCMLHYHLLNVRGIRCYLSKPEWLLKVIPIHKSVLLQKDSEHYYPFFGYQPKLEMRYFYDRQRKITMGAV